jgi:2-polyprenyl-3-methyl-5-hydroxy-6-metoxy-1,4-benzoquinol methylase
VFVPRQYHLSTDQEQQRYDLHDNTESNAGYVRFLEQVADVVENACPPPGSLLDFGCGREAVLARLLRRRGRQCDAYDQYYGYVPSWHERRYDMVILCEVIEHCRDVRRTILDIRSMLGRNGAVTMRTRTLPATIPLERWWYAHDLTHVNFFSQGALAIVADLLQLRLEKTPAEDIFLFR